MISCQQIEKYYGAEQVLSNISFEFNEGEKVGLVGQNGAGKSTLLHILAGLEQPDRGTISVPKGTRVGYLRQIQGNDPTWTVYDVLQQGFDEALAIQQKMRETEQSMTSETAVQDPHVMDSFLRKYAELQESFERAGGYEIETRIHQIANGIGIRSEQFQHTFHELSGGEKTKVALAKLLIEHPNFLLLDEPTNHLDLHAVEWLERYISAYTGTCLIASHDRYFLDRVVTQMIEIEDGEASTYLTNYSDYHKEKQQKLLQQFAEYKDQQKRIKQMKEAIKRYIEWGNIGGNEKFFKRAASIQKALDRMDKIKRPVLERKKADFQLDFAGRSGKDVLVCRDMDKGYAGRNLMQSVTLDLAYGDRVAMIGGNGTGKSTLFKLILGDELPDAGEIRIGSRVKIGYLAQDAPPTEQVTVLQYFRDQVEVEEGEARSMLAKYLFYGAAVFKSVMNLSGGEWTRLKLALIMQQSPNFLLLDEPTNHLDIPSREALEEMLEEFPGTVLTISHDRYFINRIASQIWSLQRKQVTRYLGNFDAYKEQSEKEKVRNTPQVTESRTHAPVRENQKKEVHSTSQTSRRKLQLEQQIALKEQDQCNLEVALLSEEYRTDAEMLARIVAEQAAIQETLNALYEQWLQLEDGMER